MKTGIITAIVSMIQMVVLAIIAKKYQCMNKEDKYGGQIFIGTLLMAVTVLTNVLLLNQPQYHWMEITNFMTAYVVVLVSAVVDFYCHKIPNIILLMGIGIRFLILCIISIFYQDMAANMWIMSFLGGILCLLALLFISMVSKKGIGYGDVKLYGCLGFLLGVLDTYYILFYAVFIAAIYAAYILLGKKGDKNTRIPFGPFTYLGFLTVYMLVFWKTVF